VLYFFQSVERDSLYAVSDRATDNTDGERQSGDGSDKIVRANDRRCKNGQYCVRM
jgi:hypothetical protein